MKIKLLRKIIIILLLISPFNSINAEKNIDTDSVLNSSNGFKNYYLRINNAVLSPDASLGGTGGGTIINGVEVFKTCTTANTSSFTFTNISTTKSTNKNYTINWGDGSADWTSTNWNSTTHTYPVGLWTLTYTIEGTDGTFSTKKYTVFLGSNPAVALGNPGNTDICIGDSLTFPINGTANNDPGTIYTVTFNDGSPSQIFNHPPPASITHVFNEKSCGTTSSDGSTTYPNSFSVNIVATNLCTSSSVGVVPIYVSALPIAKFSGPSKACINTQVCFTNTSEGFQVSGGLCLEPKNVWSISPATGYTVSSSSVLGNDYGSDDASVWELGTNDLCITFNKAGTYSITIKSGSKCGLNDYTDTETRTICIEPAVNPVFSTSVTEGCSPVVVNLTNSTSLVDQCSPITYQWDVSYNSDNCGNNSNYTYTNGTNANSTEPKLNFVESGTYTISLGTNNSCGSKAIPKTIIVKKPPTASIKTISDICQTTAISTINPKGNINNCAPSSSSMTYSWNFPGGIPSTSSSAIPGSINYNSIGTHTVSLSVTNECGTTVAKNKSFTIFPLPVITGTFSACVNKTSQLSASIPGDSNSWSSSPSGIVTISASGLVKGISAGTTTVTYTDINGCTASEIFTVNPLPTAVISGDKTICENASAQIILTGSNGVAPYTFTYNINFGPNKTVTTVSGNSVIIDVPTNKSGTFTYNLVSVSDASTTACINTQSGSSTVIINAIPTIALSPINPQKICIGGTISTLTATVSVDPTNATFQWYENSINSTIGGTIIKNATNDKYTPPVYTSAGTFYYYVTAGLNTSGCGTITSSIAEVIVSPDPTITLQPITPQTLCQGSTATPLSVTANSGNGDVLKYQWYSNSVNSNFGGTIITGATNDTYLPSTDTIGTNYYYCEISQEGLDCNVKSQVAEVTIITGPSITSQPQSSSVCEGGNPTKLTVAYSNGTGTPKYQWYSNSVNSNSGGIEIIGANTSSYSPQANTKGTIYYYCEITFSSGGCNNLISDVAEVQINEGLKITDQNLTICSGDSFTIIPNNSNEDIVPIGTTYTWSYPTFSPSNAIIGASSETTPQQNFIQKLVNTTNNPITVTYTIKPSAGICLGADFSITVIVNPEISVDAIVTNSTCNTSNNGTITTTISGGTPISNTNPYTINWTGPNGFTATSANISGLAPGIYNLSIDAGCTYSNSYTITEPIALDLKTDSTKDVSCYGNNDGEISISVSGGTTPYIYNWTKNNLPFSNSEDISNLGPGIYQISITDVNSCGPITNTFTIIEPQPLAVSLISQSPNLCFGSNNGEIKTSVQGGRPIQKSTGVFDYNYAWSGPNGFVSSNQNLSNLQAGIYNLIVTDSSGCTKELVVTITQSTELKIDVTTTPISCYGSNNASISVSVSGGIPAYQIAWSNLANGFTQSNLSPDDYTFLVTDSQGCQIEKTITIKDLPMFKVNPVVKNVSCFGAKDGSIALNFAGGFNGIKLVWSDGSTAGTSRSNLGPGTYKVTISNGSPCEIERTFTIIEPPALNVYATITEPNQCANPNSGMIDLKVLGGTTPYKYSWSTEQNIQDLTRIAAGKYLVLVTDANGCRIESEYTLTNTKPLEVEVETNTNTNCETITVSQDFTATVYGGTPPFQYNWSLNGISDKSNNSPTMKTSKNGWINLLVRDKYECTATYSYYVELPKMSTPLFENNSIGYSTYGVYSINDPIQFTNTTEGEIENIAWDFGDGTFSTETNPVHSYSIPKSYVVTQTITFSYGCVNVNKITLEVEKGYLLVVPDAFTPNNDSVNDTFRPVTRALKNVRMDVYDTWGSLIYSENGDSLRGWDGSIKGTLSENGNFNCIVSGETFYGEVIKETTTFVLLK
ncbi:MAG TPA: PKD domain-containing protein [Flavobacterium sp.]|nr:PKD domain-containing protein [Flavobacterium sp.]